MADKKQPEKDQLAEIVWDTKMREDAIDFSNKVSRQLRKYLSSAVKYAHQSNQVLPEDFWRRLFIPSRNAAGREDSVMKPGRGTSPGHCPPDPYQELDIQAV